MNVNETPSFVRTYLMFCSYIYKEQVEALMLSRGVDCSSYTLKYYSVLLSSTVNWVYEHDYGGDVHKNKQTYM